MKGSDLVPDSFRFEKDEEGGTEGVALGNAILDVIRQTELKEVDEAMNALTSVMIAMAVHNGISRGDVLAVFARALGAETVEIEDDVFNALRGDPS